MSKRDKRLKKLRQNQKNITFNDLRKVLEDFGFELKRVSGSHHTFRAVINNEPQYIVVPYRKPIKPVYVREALRLIDQIIAELDED